MEIAIIGSGVRHIPDWIPKARAKDKTKAHGVGKRVTGVRRVETFVAYMCGS